MSLENREGRLEGAELVKGWFLRAAAGRPFRIEDLEWVDDLNDARQKYILRVSAVGPGYLPTRSIRLDVEFSKQSLETFKLAGADMAAAKITPQLDALQSALSSPVRM